MKSKLLLLFLIPLFTTGQSQIDSIKSLIHISREDSTRVDLYLELAELYKVNNYIDSAIGSAQLGLTIADSASLNDRKTRALNYLGNFSMVIGDFIGALNYFTESYNGDKEIRNTSGMAKSLNNIGGAHYYLGDFGGAISNWNASLKLKLELGDSSSIAAAYNNIGIIHTMLNDYPMALECFVSAINYGVNMMDKTRLSAACTNIGNLYQLQGNYDYAFTYYKKVAELGDESFDQLNKANALMAIGAIYRSIEEYDSSIVYMEKSMEKFKELKDKYGISQSYTNLGNAKRDVGEYQEADKFYRQSLILKTEMDEKSGLSNVYGNIAENFLLAGQYDSAVTYSMRGLDIARSIRNRTELKYNSMIMYQAQLKLNEIDKSLQSLNLLKTTLDADLEANYFSLSEQEKELYFATMAGDYGRYFDFTTHFGNQYPELLDTAFNIAIRTKGLSLKSSTHLRQIIRSSQDTTLIYKYDRWIEIKEEIVKREGNGENVSDLQTKSNKLERELVDLSNAFSDFETTLRANWKQLRERLEENEAAIEFIHYQSVIEKGRPIKYVALIVRKDSDHPVLVDLCTAEDLTNVLESPEGSDNKLINRIYGTRENYSTALYDLIWKPIEKELSGMENVYYSPTGLLHKISFSAIATKKNLLLCDALKLYQFHNATELKVSAYPKELISSKALLVGGIDYDDSVDYGTWSFLPGTKAETNSIHALTKDKFESAEYLLGNDAEESRIKSLLPNSNFVHISTHGFFFPNPDDVQQSEKEMIIEEEDLTFRGATNYANLSFVRNNNPMMRSGIVLSGANRVWSRSVLDDGEDGVLTAAEVATIDMRNTELVVLSACETGLGDIKGSEGVYGLQRSFKMAGLKYLIMSLWQVPDKETAEFMTTFYQHLTKTNDIKQSFNQTQAEMRKKYDPYYWAAFVLVE